MLLIDANQRMLFCCFPLLKWTGLVRLGHSPSLRMTVFLWRDSYAAKFSLVISCGSSFCGILPSALTFASSALSSAPTNIAKLVQ